MVAVAIIGMAGAGIAALCARARDFAETLTVALIAVSTVALTVASIAATTVGLIVATTGAITEASVVASIAGTAVSAVSVGIGAAGDKPKR